MATNRLNGSKKNQEEAEGVRVLESVEYSTYVFARDFIYPEKTCFLSLQPDTFYDTIAPPFPPGKVAHLGRQNAHVNRSGKSRALRAAGNPMHARVGFANVVHARRFMPPETRYRRGLTIFFLTLMDWFRWSGAIMERLTLRSISSCTITTTSVPRVCLFSRSCTMSIVVAFAVAPSLERRTTTPLEFSIRNRSPW